MIKKAGVVAALVVLTASVSGHTTTDPDHSPVTNDTDFKHPSEHESHSHENQTLYPHQHSNSQGLLERISSWINSIFKNDEEESHAHKSVEKEDKRTVASWVIQTYRANVVDKVFYVKEAEFQSITESKYPSFYRMNFSVKKSGSWNNKTVLASKDGEKVFFGREVKIPDNYEMKSPSEALGGKK